MHGAHSVQVRVCAHRNVCISPHKRDHSSPNHLQCNREYMPHISMQEFQVLEQCGVREAVRHHLPCSLHLRFSRKVQTAVCCRFQTTILHPSLFMIAWKTVRWGCVRHRWTFVLQQNA
eukprot:148682-Pelagomonas_calceolata.AAC.1